MDERPRGMPRAGLTRRVLLTACLVLAAVLGTTAAASAAPGDVAWRDLSQRVAGGHDEYTALALTSSGEAYAAGSTAPEAVARADVLVRKYAPGGAVRWRRVWTYPGATADVARDIARDRRGSVIIAGSSGTSWLLIKYRANGYLEWVRRGRKPYAKAELSAVAVDPRGNVYATGSATAAGAERRFFTIKYSAGGAFRWRATLGSTAGDASSADIAFGGGSVYVAGRFATGPATSTCTTVKYSAAGAKRWIATLAAAPGDAAEAVSVGCATGPVVAGTRVTASGRPDGFVVRYTAEGEERWVAGYSGGGDLGDRFTAMTVEPSGACVTGQRLNGGGEEMITLRFDLLGSLVWEDVLHGAASGYAVCRAATGACYSAGGTDAITVGQTTATGLPGWRSLLTPAGHTAFRPAVLQAAGDDAVYAAGWAERASGGTSAMLVRYQP